MILLIRLKPKHEGAKRLGGETSRGELTKGQNVHKSGTPVFSYCGPILWLGNHCDRSRNVMGPEMIDIINASDRSIQTLINREINEITLFTFYTRFRKQPTNLHQRGKKISNDVRRQNTRLFLPRDAQQSAVSQW